MSAPTLDSAVIQGELKEVKKALEEQRKTISELAERVARVEMNADVSQTGLNEIYRSLEAAGIMRDGEPAKTEKEPRGESWDPAKIVWVDTTGGRGPYQKSQDVNSVDFKALLRCLQGHHGKMTKDGYFMWVFQDGCTIGRKKRGTPT